MSNAFNAYFIPLFLQQESKLSLFFLPFKTLHTKLFIYIKNYHITGHPHLCL